MTEAVCPVRIGSVGYCGKPKSPHHLTCASHWRKVPKVTQEKIYQLYREAPESEGHRLLCEDTLKRLSEPLRYG